MGPTGNQSLTYAQNRTLAESPKTGIPVHLLEALDPLKYTCAGEVELVGAPYQEEQVDDTGKPRKVWMFPVRPKDGSAIPTLTDQQARAIEESHARIARRLSMKELQARAKKAKKQPSVRTAQTSAYVRDAAVAEYTKRLAGGKCDLCEKTAPFRSKRNEPYLECHHIIWLAQGGEMANTVALCPNCHRKMHVLNHKTDKEKLTKQAAGRAAD
jgi:5-methylcytosine-specific restriction enzyme A